MNIAKWLCHGDIHILHNNKKGNRVLNGSGMDLKTKTCHWVRKTRSNSSNTTTAVVLTTKALNMDFGCRLKQIKKRQTQMKKQTSAWFFMWGQFRHIQLSHIHKGFHLLIWRTQSSLNYREIRAGLRCLWESQPESSYYIHQKRQWAAPVASQPRGKRQFRPNLGYILDIKK